MEIRDLKHAEELLIDSTQNEDIKHLIETKIETLWHFDFENFLELVNKINKSILTLSEEIFLDNLNTTNYELLQWIVFEKIHDTLLPCFKAKFYDEDLIFFKKSILLCNNNVSADQFGADENYTIPLSAAVVELSMIDSYKSPGAKMNCLCTTYDLVFAEIKTAMVSIISENSEKENDIPIIDNRDILPILMIVIVQSKLVYLFSNLFYIKSFYNKMEENHLVFDIFKAFEKAVNNLVIIDVNSIRPDSGRIIRSMNPEEYIKITSPSEEKIKTNTNLVDEANQRVLNLITRSTSENELFE